MVVLMSMLTALKWKLCANDEVFAVSNKSLKFN